MIHKRFFFSFHSIHLIIISILFQVDYPLEIVENCFNFDSLTSQPSARWHNFHIWRLLLLLAIFQFH